MGLKGTFLGHFWESILKWVLPLWPKNSYGLEQGTLEARNRFVTILDNPAMKKIFREIINSSKTREINLPKGLTEVWRVEV